MKRFAVLILLSLAQKFATAQDLSYYLPQHLNYSPAVPKPKDVIHHEVGAWHVTHDRLVQYMKAVAASRPERVKLEQMGFTFENREQPLLIITSAANHTNLEKIRQQHLRLYWGESSDMEKMPAVVWIGHSIHGNESSGANAALLGAYYLAAAEGAAIDSLLQETVILYDPCFNPDGLQRFSTWANQHRSKNLVTDVNSREFNEVWPGGRFNHYWFDLNRDWLPQVHIESRNRVAWFHKWKPNILTDHHEMGSQASFFFQPGVPSRVNPLTPAINQQLTGKIASYHARYLDKLGSLYFTKEGYDDFYYGKGSTYPDVQGCVGILFEQASSRGHAQQTPNGVLTFPFTIRNQFTTELSTLEAARYLRKELLNYQLNFFRSAIDQASTQSYVFGDASDKARTRLFAEMLRRNDIEVYELATSLKTNDGTFEPGASFVVPLKQPQTTLIRSIFEKTLNYSDSLFYDISSWTMPLAFGLPYTLTQASRGGPMQSAEKSKNQLPSNPYAFILEWNNFYAPAALYRLLDKGITAKLSTKSFESNTHKGLKKFEPGTVIIPMQLQQKSETYVSELLRQLIDEFDVTVFSTQTGMAVNGVDLGSGRMLPLSQPKCALLVGTGINATDAGEVWHLFDQYMQIPLSHLEATVFNRAELSKYNTLIMTGGNFSDFNKEKLKTWIQQGGLLICTEEAVTWCAQNGINQVKLKKAPAAVDSSARLPYSTRDEVEGAQQMSGAIFLAEVDLSHPLAYGYSQKNISMFKANKVYLEKSRNPFATPFYYGKSPLQSGWLSMQNLEAVKNSAAVLVNTVGNGRVINIDNNPCFRGFWLGGTRLLMNAVFFGKLIDAGSGREE